MHIIFYLYKSITISMINFIDDIHQKVDIYQKYSKKFLNSD